MVVADMFDAIKHMHMSVRVAASPFLKDAYKEQIGYSLTVVISNQWIHINLETH